MTENLLLTVLTAVLCENFLLEHLCGTEAVLNSREKPIKTLLRGLLMTVIMTASSVISFAVSTAVLEPNGMEYLTALLFAVILAVFELAAEPIPAKILRENGSVTVKSRVFLNSAVFAVILLAADYADLREAVLFGAVSGIGFTLASLLISNVRERMETADIPESFRGLPILLIAAGLCAMTFTGFAGLSF